MWVWQAAELGNGVGGRTGTPASHLQLNLMGCLGHVQQAGGLSLLPSSPQKQEGSPAHSDIHQQKSR